MSKNTHVQKLVEIIQDYFKKIDRICDSCMPLNQDIIKPIADETYAYLIALSRKDLNTYKKIEKQYQQLKNQFPQYQDLFIQVP